VDPRFDLDRQDRGTTDQSHDDGVPRALISLDRDRDFDPHQETPEQSSAESIDGRHLRGIADRIWTWIGAHSDVETDRCPDPAEVSNGDVHGDAAFDPADLRCGQSDGTPDLRHGQASHQARRTDLESDEADVAGGAPPAAIDVAFTRWHRLIIAERPAPAIIRVVRAAGSVCVP
jgi:hypothetical protein